MRKTIILIVVFIVLLAAPTGLRYLQFYQLGGVERELPQPYDPAAIAEVPTPPASEFTDEPDVGEGLVLLDQGHANAFTLDEISYLDGRLAARGYELLSFTGGDLAAALRPVTAFIVITPLAQYGVAEIQAAADFVKRGGRLLMVGDPTRFEVIFDEEDVFNFSFEIASDKIPLNSLANEFDIIFNGDYLYNVTENEGNFRNIILREDQFAEGYEALTLNVRKLAFYGSHSLQVGPEGTALFTADDNTWSTATDRPGGLVLAAAGRDGRVLALGDIHFLTEPYYTVYDNSRFIAYLADFLTEPEDRSFVLADFPFLFKRDVNLIYAGDPELGPDAFDEIIALQTAFRQVGQNLSLADEPQDDHDALYVGLYNQADEIVAILETQGISLTIKPPVPTEEELQDNDNDNGDEDEEDPLRLIESAMGNVQMSGTALILLDDTPLRRTVVLLAASKEGLESAIERMMSLVAVDADSVLGDCLIRDEMALCPTGVADEAVEAELKTGGAPEANGNGGADNGDSDANGDADNGDTDTDNDNGGDDEIDGVLQGSINLGDTVSGNLAESEAHLWLFAGGPAVVDIFVDGDENIDLVVELYGPDNTLITSADNTFTGEEEQLLAADIPDDGEYTIRVRDFFGNEGGYTLTVIVSEGVGAVDGDTAVVLSRLFWSHGW